jgi:acyl-CoA synthetase (AMP-forming)/AMP-acid ligase II
MRATLAVMQLGGTVVSTKRFDAERSLALLEEYAITHSQWVPTMFIRMLRLPEAERARYDLSAHEVAIHAAAPCPAAVKRAMIEWWGPILYEYYSATEGHGFTAIDSQDWLAHPGSVGTPVIGEPHIVGDDGEELAPGEMGVIYFSGGNDFSYHNDPEKTKASRDPWGRGWATVGDIGYLDEHRYLYLTDRATHMIISGGVNIYPQEVEDLLILHPAVDDVAVFGVPDPDMGEQVKAVVQAADPAAAGAELEAQLIAYCREHLAHFKCPRSVDFSDQLPRQATGKMNKHELVRRYREAAGTGA